MKGVVKCLFSSEILNIIGNVLINDKNKIKKINEKDWLS